MLRNKEIRQFTVIFAVLTVILAAAGFSLQPAAGWLLLSASAAYGALFFAFTRARYRRLAELSEQIDRVLHNAERFAIEEMEEGELSILSSEITKMTQRLREQADTLRREKERLADSLADISHQLRTPLTSLSILLSLARSEPDIAKRTALLREAEGLFSRMDWLLTALLKLSRLDANVVEFQQADTDANALLTAALRPLLLPMELHGITLTRSIPENVTLPGDPNWLIEALQNLLKNGMESAGDGGNLTVTCTDTLLYTELTIRDSGPGIPADDLPYLFDRFYRGKSAAAAGYGIGLALTRTILARQNASVSARNHPDGGACFTLRFPKP